MDYRILITAQSQKDIIAVYNKQGNVREFSSDYTFEDWLNDNFPLLAWQADDGRDFDEDEDTDYCQYVCYPSGERSADYILAVYANETMYNKTH